MRELELQIGAAGAVVEAHIGIGDALRRYLSRSGPPRTIPAAIPVQLLVDTGATCSWIDEMHIRSLGLVPKSWGDVHRSGGQGLAKSEPFYEVSLSIGGPVTANIARFPLLIGEQSFINQPFDGLIGRDLLNLWRLGWDGPARRLRLQYT